MNKNVLLLLAVILVPNQAYAMNDDNSAGYKATSTGIVIPNRSVSMSAKISGRINAVNFEEGDRVNKGDTLLTMEDGELQAELAHARASSSLARVELEHAKRTEGRFQRLAKTRSAAEDQLDEARYGFAAAAEKLRIAEAEEARVTALLKESRLVAPFDAVVTERNAEVGLLTTPGEKLFVLEDQTQLKLRTRVKERDVARIELGQRIDVVVDALNGVRLDGKVSKVVPSGDSSHTFAVEATLPLARGLYPGMFGKAQFVPVGP